MVKEMPRRLRHVRGRANARPYSAVGTPSARCEKKGGRVQGKRVKGNRHRCDTALLGTEH